MIHLKSHSMSDGSSLTKMIIKVNVIFFPFMDLISGIIIV